MEACLGVQGTAGVCGTLLAVVLFLCLPIGLLSLAIMASSASDRLGNTELFGIAGGVGAAGGVLVFAAHRVSAVYCDEVRCKCCRCCSCCSSASSRAREEEDAASIERSESSRRRARYVAELERMAGGRVRGGRGLDNYAHERQQGAAHASASGTSAGEMAAGSSSRDASSGQAHGAAAQRAHEGASG